MCLVEFVDLDCRSMGACIVLSVQLCAFNPNEESLAPDGDTWQVIIQSLESRALLQVVFLSIQSFFAMMGSSAPFGAHWYVLLYRAKQLLPQSSCNMILLYLTIFCRTQHSPLQAVICVRPWLLLDMKDFAITPVGFAKNLTYPTHPWQRLRPTGRSNIFLFIPDSSWYCCDNGSSFDLQWIVQSLQCARERCQFCHGAQCHGGR